MFYIISDKNGAVFHLDIKYILGIPLRILRLQMTDLLPTKLRQESNVLLACVTGNSRGRSRCSNDGITVQSVFPSVRSASFVSNSLHGGPQNARFTNLTASNPTFSIFLKVPIKLPKLRLIGLSWVTGLPPS